MVQTSAWAGCNRGYIVQEHYKYSVIIPPPPPKKKLLDAYWKPSQAIDATYKQVEDSGFKKYKKP